MKKITKIVILVISIVLVLIAVLVIWSTVKTHTQLSVLVNNARYSSTCEKMVAMQSVAGLPIPFKTAAGEKIYQVFFFVLNPSYPMQNKEPLVTAPAVVAEIRLDATSVCTKFIIDPSIKIAADYGPRFSAEAKKLSISSFDSRKNDLYLATEKVAEKYFADETGDDAKIAANDFFDQFTYLSEPGLKQFYYNLNPDFWQWVEKLTEKNSVPSYNVYHGDKLVAIIKPEPGPVVSTATPPPPGQEIQHPFLTATALVPAEENNLYQLLQKAKNFDDFVNLLKANGYTVSLVNP